MEWTEDSITRLRSLWSDGHSTAEIGRRLGVSKNAVVGKAHRLDLPARPSPIRREAFVAVPPRPLVRRIAGPTLPPLPSAERAAPSQPRRPEPPRTEPLAAPPPNGEAKRAEAALPRFPVPSATASRVQVVSQPYGRTVACCWPVGEPGTREFRFCDAASLPGKPYCAGHAELAYVKVRDRREDAA